jgi:hypothetical protein
LASATSWARIASTPTAKSSSNAGTCATQLNHAGETSKRRAPPASRSGPP